MAQKVIWVPGSTTKVCQLTGENDRQWKRPTPNITETRFGLRGTDLGASFEHKGKVWFLFGDTHPTGRNNELRPVDGDSLAFSNATNPESNFQLTFVTAPDGHYRAISAAKVSLKGFEVPTGGVSHNGRMYVFCTTDAQVRPEKIIMGRAVLLRSQDDGKTFTNCGTISQKKFINIAPVVVTNRLWKGLPQSEGQGILLFASSTQYRHSDPYLAYLPLLAIEDLSKLRYFAGNDARGVPHWSSTESDAKTLFTHPCIGELSVTYNPFLRKWLMLYNGDKPRGINFRVADAPWGPWSETALLFAPWRDKAYGEYMHVSDRFKPMDKVHDAGRENEWGGEYGPYVVERFTRGVKGRATIYYVLSTWNPYNTVLIKSTLQLV